MKPTAHSDPDRTLFFYLHGRKTEMRISTATVEHFWEVSARKAQRLLSLQVQVRNKFVYAGLDK